MAESDSVGESPSSPWQNPPREILECLFGHFLHHERDGRTLLRNCRQVNHSWRSAARRVLLADVTSRPAGWRQEPLANLLARPASANTSSQVPTTEVQETDSSEMGEVVTSAYREQEKHLSENEAKPYRREQPTTTSNETGHSSEEDDEEGAGNKRQTRDGRSQLINTARKRTGGKAPRKMLATRTPLRPWSEIRKQTPRKMLIGKAPRSAEEVQQAMKMEEAAEEEMERLMEQKIINERE